MLKTILMVIQVIVSLVLIGSILLQSGKDPGLSGAIGGGGSEQGWAKQARGFEGMLSKVTSIAAALFIIVAITLVAIQ